MKNKLIILLMIISLLISGTGAFATSEVTDDTLDLNLSSGGYIDAIVYLKDDFDVNLYEVKASNDDADKAEQRNVLVEDMKNSRESSQNRLVEYLEGNLENDELRSYETFFIVNAIHIVAKLPLIEELSSFSEVKYIQNNGAVEVKTSQPMLASHSVDTMGWNLNQLKVQNVWNDMGINGSGVTVGFIDSGVSWEHPAIKNNWRGYNQTTGEVSPIGNWLDLVHDSELPTDDYSHGTAIVSIAVGETDDLGSHIGMAPGAKWIAVRAFEEKNTTNVNIIKAAEWMLAPGGDPTKAPDIINNSWGGEASTNPWFQDIIAAWRAAGIVPIFAAGNALGSRAEPGSIENPASLPGAFSVGAVNKYLKVTDYSKRGPSKFDPEGKLIKPEVVAPGSLIKVAVKNNEYGNMYGTSIAAPHISGLAALMLSRMPSLKVEMVEKLIVDSCNPLSDEIYTQSPNMAYGYGIPDAHIAIASAGILDKSSRISGENRYDTAVKISERYFPSGSETVYITSGTALSDALVMPSLTRYEAGPVLLTQSDQIPGSTASELVRLAPKKIVVVGGGNSISDKILEELKSITGAEVSRIAGASRYETSTEIARQLFKKGEFHHAFLVNGVKDVDAISIAGTAAMNGEPVLLSEQNSIPKTTEELIELLKLKKITIIGGEGTISEELEKLLADKGIEVNRLGGNNRFDTSRLINENYYPSSNLVFLANGVTIVDALTASPLAGGQKTPMVLVETSSIPESSGEYIKNLKAEQVIVLGGENSVSVRTVYDLLIKKF